MSKLTLTLINLLINVNDFLFVTCVLFNTLGFMLAPNTMSMSMLA
jgi:hypothetical protein